MNLNKIRKNRKTQSGKLRKLQYDIDSVIEWMNNFDFLTSRNYLVAIKRTLNAMECEVLAELMELDSKSKKKRKRP
jgi:hypothetical protein